MKLTKCFLVASAAALAGSLLSNVPSRKNEVFKASILDTNVRLMVERLHNSQGKTNLNNFANYYFSNLNNNFGVNTHGTCSFVAMGMLLSFYDTYLNDSFVPDAFEENTYVEPDSEGTILTKDVESPGVTYDDFVATAAMDRVDYEDYVVDNPNASFQNFLFNYAYNNDFDIYFDGNSNIGLDVNTQVGILNAYLADYVGLTNSVYSVTSNYSTGNLVSNVKNILAQGQPVILNVHSYVIGNHSVVAYDYDDSDIYVHTGWKDANGNALTHVSLKELSNNLYPSTTISSYVAINTNNVQIDNDLDNYYTVDDDDNVVPVSLKTLAVPFDFRMEYEPNEPEELPEFIWNSLYNERWFSAKTATFQIKIRDYVTNDIIAMLPTINNATSAVIPENIFNQVIDGNGMFKFVVEMRTILPEAVVGTKRVFNQTTVISNTQDYVKIGPADYGFPTRYTTYASDFVDASTNDGFDFKVRKSLNVSRSGNNVSMNVNYQSSTEAFIEYNFYKPITEIKLTVKEYDNNDGVAMASNYNFCKGALFVQGFKNGQYYPNIEGVSQNERHANSLLAGHESEFASGEAVLTYEFCSPVYRVRIHASADEPISVGLDPFLGGRIAKMSRAFSMFLGDVYVKPVEGNYLPGNGYEFHVGDMTEMCPTNDYVYALSLNDDIIDGFYTPGEFTSDEFYDYTETEYCNDIDIITEMCEADAAPGGLTGSGYTFEQIDKNAIPDDGCYKIALAIVAPANDLNNPNKADYRFFRQNSDGTWSFVNFDTCRVTNKDFTGHLIYDPSNVIFKEGNQYFKVRSAEEIRFFQVTRNKGSMSGEEEELYFPMMDIGGTLEYTWDERQYIIRPPFRPIFTGEF